jgi:hypothetical protein
MRQAVVVNHNVPFNTGHFFTGIITFLIRRISILDALGIHYAQRSLGIPPV